MAGDFQRFTLRPAQFGSAETENFAIWGLEQPSLAKKLVIAIVLIPITFILGLSISAQETPRAVGKKPCKTPPIAPLKKYDCK